MNCKKCGKRLGKDEVICKRCGNDTSVDNSKVDIISSMKSQLQNSNDVVDDNAINNEEIEKVEEVKEVEEIKTVYEEVANNIIPEPQVASEMVNKQEVINTKTEDFDTISNMDVRNEKTKNPLPALIIVICILLCAIIFVKIKIDQYKINEGIDNEITLQDLELKERQNSNDKKSNYLNDTNTTNTSNEIANNTVNEVKNETVNNTVNEDTKTENAMSQDSINGNLVNEILEKRNKTNTNTTVKNNGASITSSYKTKNSNE